MWASDLADEAPGVRLTLCKGCGLPAMSERHCQAPEPPPYRMLHGRLLPTNPARAIVAALVQEGGKAHFRKVAARMGVDEVYTSKKLEMLNRKRESGIVRVARGTYAYLPEEMRRDQPS